MRVLTLGTFDLFHEGHVRLLERCRWIAGPDGSVIVGLNTDRFIEQYKGRPPVIPYKGRREVLRACRFVDTVEANDGPGRACIGIVRPDMIVVGSDWRERDYLGQIDCTQDGLDQLHVLLTYVPYTQGVSSTAIRAAIA